MQGITSTYVTSSAAVVYPALAVYLDFAGVDGNGNPTGSVPVALWSGYENKTLNSPTGSITYTGVGTLGSVSNITETTDIAAKQVTLMLSGIPNDYIALALSNPYRDRLAVVYLVLFNADYSAYEQITIFRGRMDQLSIVEGEGTSTVAIKCESRLIDINKYNDLRYTDEAQKRINPNDNGLKYVGGLFNKSVYWGTSAPATSTVASGRAPSPIDRGDSPRYGL